MLVLVSEGKQCRKSLFFREAAKCIWSISLQEQSYWYGILPVLISKE